ncbi:MAG: S8 family serine peptidase [Roseiflexus sp.]|nr:S8 family serine peptidase [Roseiflexus sp.]MCS7290972.1 S8 family serine peptidase [Roseiflexus sp.]MDW8147747.1 S8 family serine peptidase [Roseiflexaceae bacterium]MDW8232818.1 S8 family serine peptidase [Roseiflexaceae bacterium]
MRQRLTLLLAVLGIALSAMPAHTISRADEPEPLPFTTDASGRMLAPPGYPDPRQPLTIMLDLGDSAQEASPEGISAPQSVPVDGKEIRRLLEAANIPVLFQTRTAYNGIAVAATPDQLALLRRLPGIAGIHIIPPKERSTARAISFIGAPEFWSATGHLTGAGVRIGIIDSGIDYTHATFGGPGTPEAFRANNPTIIEPGTFPTEKVIAGYDFVGDSYDASGQFGSPLPNPDPDPLDCAGDGADAARRISGGHGTHVAGVAAGYGVDASGRTYRGLYSASVSFADFMVAPGVAPGATLVALKIFGCRGTTTFLTRAIDYAIDPNGDGDTSDRLVDVLNISLGSPFGGETDPDVVAVNRAVEAGIVVVVAAGDTGNTFYSVSSPASAVQAIAVGASVDAERDPLLPSDTLDLLTSRGPQRAGMLKPDLVAPGVAVRSAAAGSGVGARSLSGTSIAAPQVAGAAALLRQLRPSWTPAQIKAALMNAARPTRDAAGNLYPPSLTGAGRLDVSKLFAYDVLAFDANDPSAVALSFGARWISRPQQFQKTLRITNTGSHTRTLRIAPVTAAEEQGVRVEVSPGPYALSPGRVLDVPVNVSVDPAALDFTRDATTPPRQTGDPPVFERYYMAEHSGIIEIRSTLGARMRVVHAGDFDGVTVHIDEQVLESSIGPGRAGRYRTFSPGRKLVRVFQPEAPLTSPPLVAREFDVADGRDYTIVVYGSWSNPQLALIDEIPDPSVRRDRVMLHVFNGDPLRDGSAVDVYLDGALLVANLPVGAVSAFSATSPGKHKVRFFRAGSSPATSTSAASKEFIAGSGEVILVIGGGHVSWSLRGFTARGRLINEQTTRVPFQIIPKSASEIAATQSEHAIMPDATTFSIALRNSGARNQSSSPRGAQTPLVSAYELAPEGRSPQIAGLAPSLRSADLRYVGVTSSYLARGWEGDNTVIFFGLAGYGAWATPNEVQYRVYISTTGPGGSGLPDDIPEFVLVNTSLGAVLPVSGTDRFTRPNDVFRAILYRIESDGTLTVQRLADWSFIPPPSLAPFLDSAPFDTSVMVLMTTAGFLDLSPGAPVFNYYVETYARDAGGFTERIDRVPANGVITYDLRSAAVAPLNTLPATGVIRVGLPTPFFFGVDGAQITGMVNQDMLALRRTQDILLLYHHNSVGTQAEVVTLQSLRMSGPTSPELEYRHRVCLPMIVTP